MTINGLTFKKTEKFSENPWYPTPFSTKLISELLLVVRSDAMLSCKIAEKLGRSTLRKYTSVSRKISNPLVPDSFVPENPYNLWISIGLNTKNI
jgi:hypothetical protein